MNMKITVLSLFPEVVETVSNVSIVKRAQEKGLVEIEYVNLRDYAIDDHGTVDDRPFGGAAGMVLRIEPIVKALTTLVTSTEKAHVVLTSARGKKFSQEIAESLATKPHTILIAGHYEAVDERISDYIDEEISIGDYVLTGGELPLCIMIDSVVRLLPGVLKKEQATDEESFSEVSVDEIVGVVGLTQELEALKKAGKTHVRLLEYPHYTRPQEFEGNRVPDILTSGDHSKIRKWQIQKAYDITLERRPDLLS
jgi:tRNA (guanine37-N1)-methyltransferase